MCQDRQASEQRFHENRPFLLWWLRRYLRGRLPSQHTKEIRAAAEAAFFRSCRSFDPERRAAFSTYALTALHRAMIALHRTQPRLPTVSLDTFYDDPEDSQLRLADPRAVDPPNEAHRRDQAAHLHELLDTLPPREKRILHERFWKGRNLQEIGDSFNLTCERVRQIEQAALRWLRTEMENPTRPPTPYRPSLPRRKPPEPLEAFPPTCRGVPSH